MLAVSDRFLEQLREPHVVVVEAFVVPAGGGDPYPVKLTGGSVTGDRTAQVRRSCTVELAAADAAALAQLPYGAYLQVRRGVRFGDLSAEVPQLGLFRVDGVSAATPAGTATINTSDRMAQVRDEPLLAPFAAGGAIASTRIAELVHTVFPGLPVHVFTAGEPVLADVTYTNDRAAAVAQLAQSIAAEAYFDAAGELVIAPVPDAAAAEPVWTIDAGEHGVLVSHVDSRERAGAANGVLVRGQAAADQPPLEVLVHDDDPASPTLYGGPFGRVVVVIESTAVQTIAQATELAQLELAKRLGLTRTLQLVAAPNPALEPGDVVDVVLADGTVERHVLDTVAVPLDPQGAVTATSRSSTGATVGGGFGMVAGDAAWEALAGAELALDEPLEVPA